MSFEEWAHGVGRSFEVVAVAVLVAGFVAALVGGVLVWRSTGSGRAAYRSLRELLGGALLIALEILVAADLVSTVAVSPTLENISVLGLIVLIRTFLSFSLETEIEGVFPWRRSQTVPRRDSSGAGDASGSENRLPGALERSGATAPHHDKEGWRHERS